jgi:50S ribosomal protein L16 3-hydroxylase
MIYIPPNVAHHGISIEDSISYSIGFKSIRYKNLLDQFATDLMSDLDDKSFHDLQMPIANDPFILEDYVVEKVYKELFKVISDKENFKNSLLKHLTRPKNIASDECTLNEAVIEKRILKQSKFKRDIWAKFVASKADANTFNIAINSNSFCVNKKVYLALSKWFSLDPDLIHSLTTAEVKDSELVKFVVMLVKNGVFYFA